VLTAAASNLFDRAVNATWLVSLFHRLIFPFAGSVDSDRRKLYVTERMRWPKARLCMTAVKVSTERGLKSYWSSWRDDSIRAGRYQRAFRELRRINSAAAIWAKRLQTRRKLKSEDRFQTCLWSIRRSHSSFMISEKISTGSFENGQWRHGLTKLVS